MLTYGRLSNLFNTSLCYSWILIGLHHSRQNSSCNLKRTFVLHIVIKDQDNQQNLTFSNTIHFRMHTKLILTQRSHCYHFCAKSSADFILSINPDLIFCVSFKASHCVHVLSSSNAVTELLCIV